MSRRIVEDLSLPRLALEIAVDQLTRPEAAGVSRDDGAALPHLPSLIVQLEQAKDANSGRGGAFSAASKPPLWVDAVSLLAEVDVETRGYDGRDRSCRVRAWSGAMHDLIVRDDLEEAVAIAEGWVRRARALLDPSPPTPLEGACPECGQSWLEALNDDGERVRRRTLLATESPAVAWCESSSCPARWEGESLWLLADALRAQSATEVLSENARAC